MKVAFSTSACSDFSWPEMCDLAKDLGYDGLEICAYQQNYSLLTSSHFSAKEMQRTKQTLSLNGLEIACISSGCCIKNLNSYKSVKEELTDYIELAKSLSVPYVSVLGDSELFVGEQPIDDSEVVAALRDIKRTAKEAGVTLLVVTSGAFSDTKRLRNLLDAVASDNVAALWDMHNTYRVMGETPETTIQNLAAYINYTHIKDSVMAEDGIKYKMMGDGDLPLEEIMQALRSINYGGYISLDWFKEWSVEVETEGLALSHFIDYINSYIKPTSYSTALYQNVAQTGYYIWEKDSLIDLNFSQLLDTMAEYFPTQTAIRYVTHDYTKSYSEFREDVDRFARSLISMGVKKGDKVAIWSTNVPEWFITFWATVKIGAILVTVNTAYKSHELEYLLKQSDTHTLVMNDGYKDSNYIEIVNKVCPELKNMSSTKSLRLAKFPFLRNIITIDSVQNGCISWEDAISMASKTSIEEVQYRAASVNRHDVCNMQYTSGTTGFPKGVMLTHYNIINNGKCIGDCMDLSTADRMLIHVPMFHCFGMVLAMTACMTHGSTMCPIPAFSPKLSLSVINDEQITCCHGVPTMFIAMLENEDFDKTDFSYMRTGIMAGSPCPVKVMQDVLDKMNMTQISIVYGQTEASPGCTQSRVDDPIDVRVGTVGRALPGIECKIVDPETGKDLPDNTDGEFVARGYNIMKGYYKMPAATASAIDQDGWLHTGDLARRLPDGNYKITGRIKDMIIRGGENIYPKEIEDFLYTHPSIKDVQVIGVPDEQYGEEVMACVILKDGETVTADELKAYVRENMAKHKTPRYIEYVTEFPMNAAGKILKYKMREMAAEKLSQ